MQALELWQLAAGLTEGPVFRQIWLPPQPKLSAAGELPLGPHRHLGDQPADRGPDRPGTRHGLGVGRRDLGGHSLKCAALTTGMDRGVRPAKLKRLRRYKSFDVLREISNSATCSTTDITSRACCKHFRTSASTFYNDNDTKVTYCGGE